MQDKNDPIVILVHGTWAASPSDTGTAWWQADSEFWRDLNRRLRGTVRCLGPGEIFHWSGYNSDESRRVGARDLAKKLLECEKKAQPYHLIGHSHGGLVIWYALRMAQEQKRLEYLRSWATLGTPFFHFRPSHLSIPTSYLGCIFLIGLLISLCWLTQAVIPLQVTLFIIGILAILSWTWRSLASLIEPFQLIADQVHQEHHFTLHPSPERWLGLWDPEDEAICALAKTTGLHQDIIVPRLEKRLPVPPPTERQKGFPKLENLVWRLQVPGQFITRVIFNHLVKPVGDRLISGQIARRSQGNNRPGAVVFRTNYGPHPEWKETDFPRLSDDILNRLRARADAAACQQIPKIRKLLVKEALEGPGFESFFRELGEKFTGRELVHTTYYNDPDIRELLCLHILNDGQMIASPATPAADWINQFKTAMPA